MKYPLTPRDASWGHGLDLQYGQQQVRIEGGGRLDLPVIQGRAPELASVAECIWRYTADHEGLAALAQLKQGLVRPHVCALPSYIDGDVSHNLHSLGVCIRLQQL